MAKIEGIVIHHSDSWFGDAAQIDNWHKQRGFKNPVTGKHIGYNRVYLNGFRHVGQKYIESLDGAVEDGRSFNEDEIVSLDERGAHTLGFNGKTFGLCFISKGCPSIKQWAAMIKDLKEYKKRWPWIWIDGHRSFNNTSCPGFDVKEALKEYGL